MKIPENPLFAPPLNIRVYDDRLILKPLVALRSIPLSPFIPWAQPSEQDLAVLNENIRKPVDQIPGAALIKEEVPPPDANQPPSRRDTMDLQSNQIAIDIPDDNAEAGLLSSQERDFKENIENIPYKTIMNIQLLYYDASLQYHHH